jgi:23S rRNA (cytidine1920-2'-O)/16S rRNA (cytidine1409-2'-O)-methyltransferase
MLKAGIKAMARGTRLDQALLERGYFTSRQQAQASIMAGEVTVDGRVAEKASHIVQEESQLTVAPRSRYVGRGGLKLEGALDHFKIDCCDKVALDIGASTGGFTDCLLQNGVRKVFAVDVGHGQLAWKIRQDPRVIVLEKTNARQLSAKEIPEPIDLCTIDVSFISLTLILPNAFQLVTANGVILALIKPQFELARADVGRGGVVRDAALHDKAKDKMRAFAEQMGAEIDGITPSVITGADGNQEFFICLRKPLA